MSHFNVTFLPMNQTFQANPGDTILDVAIANDVPIQHACGGFCACTTCHIHVQEGSNNISAMEEEEEDRLDSVDRFSEKSRLSCQSKITGDVVVEIMNLEK